MRICTRAIVNFGAVVILLPSSLPEKIPSGAKAP
jgi:hypothetical protein